MYGRKTTLRGSYRIEDGDLILSIRTFAFIRHYKIGEYNKDKQQLKLSPMDSLYCNTYTNIDYMIIERKLD